MKVKGSSVVVVSGAKTPVVTTGPVVTGALGVVASSEKF